MIFSSSIPSVTKELATATHLVAYDRDGEIWRIWITERNADGTPARSKYRCSVNRDCSDIRFAFMREPDVLVLPLEPVLDNYCANSGAILELTYEGWHGHPDRS
jgi:hypothetical protein